MSELLTCDWCGHSSNVVTRMANPPETFEHFNFCDDKDCTNKYSNFINNRDYTNGIPYSISLEIKKLKCSWCGSSKKNVVQLNDLRDPKSKFKKYRLLDSTFCKEGPCAQNYSRFIYARDLSKGLLYSVRCSMILHDCGREHYQCAYCGKKTRVVYNPWTEENLKYKTFCLNKTCYENFYNYSTVRVPKVPYAIENNMPKYPPTAKTEATRKKIPKSLKHLVKKQPPHASQKNKKKAPGK